MKIGIIGAGMAGLACAEGLSGRGHEVVLFDKGRQAGGRMSTRRLSTSAGEASFDHGAQYFTVRDDAFGQRVAAWISEGCVASWPAAGNHAYVGVPAMTAPLRSMAKGQSVHWATPVMGIERFDHGCRLALASGAAVDLDMAVVATPAEQAGALLASVAPDLASRARAVPSTPCWAVMLAFADPVGVSQNCWRAEGPIGWAARNNSKPGRTGPESWVVQASPEWSITHCEADPDWVVATLKDALACLLGVVLPELAGQSGHRWRFARSGAEGAGAIVDRDHRFGVCGDWLMGPRVEAAWLSGTALADRIG